MKSIKDVKRYQFEQLPSTQDFCRERRETGEDLLVVAVSQSGGKGTKGRSFESERGGFYGSLLLHETGKAKDAFLCVARAAVAVCKTLESYALTPLIKWPNDVLCGGKKICGILIENVFRGSDIASTIWGIGLNVNNRLSDFLAPIATSMSAQTGKTYSLAEVEERLLKYFFAPFSYADYTSRLGFLGKQVRLSSGDTVVTAEILGVTEQGELLAQVDGTQRRYAYGEVSITKDSIV